MRGIYCGHLFVCRADSDFHSCPGILVCAGKRFAGLLACTPTKRSKRLETGRRELEEISFHLRSLLKSGFLVFTSLPSLTGAQYRWSNVWTPVKCQS
ncbi:hypothetical protein BO83DRAFT_155034 [Aspergillus eucalypticola CBS 122712]|uniref:Uncharacterized protein n=1 Tax=Aspergillus eucalypticola (strain CBS 122712 / IBT 29274) TaxID=1448314 RepID=A0A317USW2_ASPEC|nr:uncharacterized protein BO83DRAFT_155034 [Aspergillus eucalypticola CBS 122712]PWY63607.1 hypothetical protein BO83DRAFT_155034 [Aspergillus eucalypticola CBS 122712]